MFFSAIFLAYSSEKKSGQLKKKKKEKKKEIKFVIRRKNVKSKACWRSCRFEWLQKKTDLFWNGVHWEASPLNPSRPDEPLQEEGFQEFISTTALRQVATNVCIFQDNCRLYSLY